MERSIQHQACRRAGGAWEAREETWTRLLSPELQTCLTPCRLHITTPSLSSPFPLADLSLPLPPLSANTNSILPTAQPKSLESPLPSTLLSLSRSAT